MKQQRARLVMVVAVLAALAVSTPAFAVDLPSAGGTVQVTADVPSNLSFNATMFELIPNGSGGTTLSTSPVTSMVFGNLASNGTFDPDGAGPLPPQPRSLNALRAYQVFFAINSQGRSYTIKQTAASLRSGTNVIPDGAFIVTPLSGIGGNPAQPLPAGITVGARGSAVATNKILFTSTGVVSTLAATYAVTDDPSKGATQPIPTNQAAGNYTTTVTFTATVL